MNEIPRPPEQLAAAGCLITSILSFSTGVAVGTIISYFLCNFLNVN